MDTGHSADNAVAKSALRDQVRAARRRRPLAAAADFAASVSRVALAWAPVRDAATVAAYVSVGSEPGTGLLLDALVAAGKRVIVPVVLPDLDLDWTLYSGRDDLAPAVRGLLEPTGPRLGVDAVARRRRGARPRPRRVTLAASGSGRAAAATTARWPGCRPGRRSRWCCTTTRSASTVPTDPHDVRVGFALTGTGVTDF